MRAINFFLVVAAVLVQVQNFGQTLAGYQLVSGSYASNLVNDAVYGESSKAGSLIFNGGPQGVSADLKGAPGNGDFSLYARCYVPKTVQASVKSGLLMIDAGFQVYLDTASDELRAEIGPSSSSSSNYRGMKVANFVATYGGRIVDVLFVRQVSTPTLAVYINGQPVSITEYTGGTPPAWDADVSGPKLVIGAPGGFSAQGGWNGRVLAATVFNRVLGSADAVELSFQGVSRDRLGRFRERIKEAGKNGFFTVSAVSWGVAASGVVTLDTGNKELDVTAASGGDGASLSSAALHSLNTGRLHRVQLDVRNDSGGTTKTVAWGAQTLGTCTGNGTFWFEFTPTVASASLAVTAGGAGSFSLANVRVVEMASYEGGRASAGYASDFSSTADSWTSSTGTVAGNIDSIGSVNDTLRFYAAGASGSHSFKRTLTGFGLAPVRVNLSVYIPSANTHVKGIGINIGGALWNVTPLVYDAWIPVQMDVLAGSTKDLLEIFSELSDASLSFTGAGVVTDDLVYVVGVTVQEVGQTRTLGNGSFDEAGRTYTGSGDNLGGDTGTFTWWSESVSGSTVLSRDTTATNTVAAGSSSGGAAARASCKIVVDGSNAPGSVSANTAVLPGRRYRLKFWAKADSTNGVPTVLVQTSGGAVSTNALTTSFVQSVVDFTAIGTTFTLSTGSGCAGRTVWLDAVEMEERGPVADLNCGVGVGYQIPDRTSNGTDGLIGVVYGNEIRHGRTVNRGTVRGTTKTNGNEKLLGGISIPTNARITSALVTSDLSATVNLGTASGLSDIASGLSVTAGRNEVGTFATRYSKSGELWVNSSAGAVLIWTVYYEVSEPY